jgi:hypothetical protein
MSRIVIDVQTGEQAVVPLTQAELDDAAARTAAEKAPTKEKIEKQRDMTLGAGLTWNGNKYHIDQTMIAALNGRLTLWQEGKIAVDAKLPIRRMDNVIELLDRKQHADLADALRLHGEAVYAASWVEKDALDKPLKEIKP